MGEEAFSVILKTLFIRPENVEAQVSIDDTLRNNEAKWSFPQSQLFVSRAVKTLLLDPESFSFVLEELVIDWEPAFIL